MQAFSAAEGFIRGRSYNIRLDDQVLLRFSPKNSDSTYYFSDMVIIIWEMLQIFMKVHSLHWEIAKQLCGSYHRNLHQSGTQIEALASSNSEDWTFTWWRSVAVHFQFYAIILCLFHIFYGLSSSFSSSPLFSPLLVFILFLLLVIHFSTTCNGNRSVELLLSFMKKELGDASR